jgi:hypothetical protein
VEEGRRRVGPRGERLVGPDEHPEGHLVAGQGFGEHHEIGLQRGQRRRRRHPDVDVGQVDREPCAGGADGSGEPGQRLGVERVGLAHDHAAMRASLDGRPCILRRSGEGDPGHQRRVGTHTERIAPPRQGALGIHDDDPPAVARERRAAIVAHQLDRAMQRLEPRVGEEGSVGRRRGATRQLADQLAQEVADLRGIRGDEP